MMVGLKRISTALAALSSAHVGRICPRGNQFQSAHRRSRCATLRSSRNLAGYRIEIETREGMVTLKGTLATSAKKPKRSLAPNESLAFAAWSINFK